MITSSRSNKVKGVQVQISKEKENKLLSRKEITAKAMFEGTTPSRHDIQKEIAKQTKSKEDMTIITNINTSFGSTTATITAHIYDNKDVLMRTERENLIKKHLGHKPKEEGEEEKEQSPKQEDKGHEEKSKEKQEEKKEESKEEKKSD